MVCIDCTLCLQLESKSQCFYMVYLDTTDMQVNYIEHTTF